MTKKNKEKRASIMILKDLFIIIVVLGITLVLFGFAKVQYLDNKINLSEVESETPIPDLSLYEQVAISISGKSYKMYLADDPVKKARGLSNQISLPENTGMFFEFKQSGRHTFWMKDMNFPIDIVWIDDTLEIVHIAENSQPESFPNTFGPNQPALHVLEFNVGFMERNGFKVGDKISIIQ